MEDLYIYERNLLQKGYEKIGGIDEVVAKAKKMQDAADNA